MIKLIASDMDGTLVDSERYYCDGTYKWLKRAGYKGDKDEVYAIIGLSMPDTYAYLQKLLDDKYDLDTIKRMNDEYFGIEDVIDYQEYIYPDVKEIIYDLKDKGYKLALCSASSYDLIDRFIADCHFGDVFDHISSTEDTKENTDPKLSLMAMDKLGLKKEECLIIEDSPNGIRAAKSSGVYTLARINEHIKERQKEADHLFTDLHDIYRYLGE